MEQHDEFFESLMELGAGALVVLHRGDEYWCSLEDVDLGGPGYMLSLVGVGDSIAKARENYYERVKKLLSSEYVLVAGKKFRCINTNEWIWTQV